MTFGLLKSAAAALSAAAAFFRYVYPIHVIRSVQREIEGYEDEIFALADDGSPSSKLRIEVLSERKKRAIEQISTIRSAFDNTD